MGHVGSLRAYNPTAVVPAANLPSHQFAAAPGSDIAVIAGGGAWSEPYREFMPNLIPEVERRFKKVILLPSSFDVNVPEVCVALKASKAIVLRVSACLSLGYATSATRG